jgi:hypothetical protein
MRDAPRGQLLTRPRANCNCYSIDRPNAELIPFAVGVSTPAYTPAKRVRASSSAKRADAGGIMSMCPGGGLKIEFDASGRVCSVRLVQQVSYAALATLL